MLNLLLFDLSSLHHIYRVAAFIVVAVAALLAPYLFTPSEHKDLKS